MNQMIDARGDNVVVYTTNTRYLWTTEWRLCHGLAAVDVRLNVRNRENAWQGKPCYQTAAVLTEYPDAATVFTAGSYLTANGFAQFRETLGLSSKLWIRFGVAASNTTGVSIGSADVDMVVTLWDAGALAGRGKVVVNAGEISGTDTNYFEVGEWSPTIGLNQIMAAFVVVNNDSTYLEYQLVCRTAIDARAPNAWQTCEAAWSNPAAGNSVRNTSALSAPAGASVTSNLLIQFGVAVRKKSGAAGNPRAEISVVVARSNA